MNNAPLLLALPKRSETNVVNANSISTSTSSSPRRHPTSAYSSPNASPRRLRRSPRRYNSSGSLDTGKCGNDDGDNDDDNVSCYSRASSCVSSVASSYAKNKSSSSNNTSKHQLRKPNPISLPRSSVATTSRDATTVGSPITPISPTTLRNSLSAMLMLGLGLRHACLNNVSADPPAKDTPHACYISLRPIAIGDYLRRFDKFAQCSDECYAVAAVLLDRWCAATGVQLHRSIVHKLTLTALVVALKMYDDQQYPMDWRAGGWRGDARADGAGASLPAHDRVACRCGPRRVRAVRGHNASGDVTADVRALSCARWVWQQCCALYTEGRQPPLSAGASDLSACGVA
eukprot:PhM_4_TR388/c5_g1_i8/m.106763